MFNSLEPTLLADDSSTCEDLLLGPGALLEPIPLSYSRADATGGSEDFRDLSDAAKSVLELTGPEDLPNYLEPSPPSAPWQQMGMVNMNSCDLQPNIAFPVAGSETIKPDFFTSVGGMLQTTPKDKNSLLEMLVSSRATNNEVGSPAASITAHQSSRWNERFHELRQFRQEHDHCCVPSHWPQNPPLAQWVKRQRYQYKILKEGQHSTMTEERKRLLEELNFVWDSHSVFWEERLNELHAFREKHAHCNVPSKYPENPTLAVWAKCQRRQFKLFCTEGSKRSNMTLERISKLARVGFIFSRRAKRKNVSLL
jgi:hypothetical protein